MPPEGIEPAIQASERPRTYASDRAVPGIEIYGITAGFTYRIPTRTRQIHMA